MQSHLDHRVTHVVVDEGDMTRMPTFEDINATRHRRGRPLLRIVTPAWVKESLEQGSVQDERGFNPRVGMRTS